MKHAPITAAIAALAALAGSATAASKLVITSINGDMNAAGNKVVGYVFNYEGPRNDAFVYTVGGSAQQLGPARDLNNGIGIAMSNDGTVFCGGLYNEENWGGFGYYIPSSMTYHGIAGRWTAATGWVNIGSFPAHAAKFDSLISACEDINGNDGRFIVGNANWAPTLGGSPVRARAFVYDSGKPDPNNPGSYLVAPSFLDLPYNAAGATNYVVASGYRISDDGKVVIGYDTSPPIGEEFGSGNRLCVWERSDVDQPFGPASQVFLDNFGAGTLGTFALSHSGLYATGITSDRTAEEVLGDFEFTKDLCKFTKNTTTGEWVRSYVGRCVPKDFGFGPLDCEQMVPIAISDDGNTIVGTASYGGRGFFASKSPFIWKAGYNGGVPVDFYDYFAAINGGTIPLPEGYSISGLQDLSADGNVILVRTFDEVNTCPDGGPVSHVTGGTGLLYLDGSAVPCAAPVILLQPSDHVYPSPDGSAYSRFGVSLNAFVAGVGPLNFQWQKEEPTGSGNWVNLAESCKGFTIEEAWSYEGVNKNQLRIGMSSGVDLSGNYRYVVSNGCGSTTSEASSVTMIVGACCWTPADSSCPVCTIEMADRCAGGFINLGGVWGGEGSVCTPNLCGDAVGACCIFGACEVLCAAECEANAGTFQGAGTTCSPADPCNPNACAADFNGVNGVTVQDIFDFLTAWLAGNSSADFNHVNGVTVQDIFDFLTAWLAGC